MGPCGMCGAEDAALLCSRCRGVYYCGTLCQKKAWKVHRAECNAAPVSPAAPVPEIAEEMLRSIDTMRPADVVDLLMKTGNASPKVTLVAVRRLGILARHERMSGTIARGGGFPALLRAIAEYASDDSVAGVNIVFYAVSALTALIEVVENGPTFTEAARAGGISTIVGALRATITRFVSGSTVARERLAPTIEYSVFTIAMLLTRDPRAASELVAVHAERVLAAALSALAMTNADVAGYASCALFRLAGLSPAALGYVLGESGVPLVLRALVAHQHDAKATGSVISALALLFKQSLPLPPAVAAATLGALTSIMKGGARTQDSSSILLAYDVADGIAEKAGIDAFVDQGGVQSTVAAAAAHAPAEPLLLLYAARLMARCGKTDAGRAALASGGGIEFLLRVVRPGVFSPGDATHRNVLISAYETLALMAAPERPAEWKRAVSAGGSAVERHVASVEMDAARLGDLPLRTAAAALRPLLAGKVTTRKG